MPIVKKKTILHDLQNAFELNLRRKSSKIIPNKLDDDDNNSNHLLDKIETVDDTEQSSQIATGVVEAMVSAELSPKQNESTEQMQNKIADFQMHIESFISKILALRLAKLASNDEKIAQLGMSFFDDNSGAMNVNQLVQLMHKTRTNLSNERKKLLVVIKRYKRNEMQNYQLDRQMQDVSIEKYYELKAEVNRIGEKLEETNKRMSCSRQQFENDVARATHVREKLFDSQNRIVTVMQDVATVQHDFFYYKQMLCEKLELKKQLRRKNESLKRHVHLLTLLPWYGQIKEQIDLTKLFIEKFE